MSALAGIPKSPEHRAKLRAVNLGKKASDETRAKMSAAAKGRSKSAETRARMSRGRMGLRPSEETRAKMSISAAKRAARPGERLRLSTIAGHAKGKPGHIPSAETRAKMRAAKLANPTRHWLGKKRGPLSEETKAKQSVSLKGKPAAYPLKRFYYKSIPFRSTYEVRVAQAFDRIGMPWVYEPKRFDLGGSTYLPDFYLPDERMYVEVKGYYGPKSAVTMSRMFEVHPDVLVAILQRPQIESLERVAAQVPQYVNH